MPSSNTIFVTGNTLTFQGKTYRCAVGKNGFSADKKEGDGCTPIGTFSLRECWVRADRLPAPQTQLPLRIITEQDGWCDDVEGPHYNQHIKLPEALTLTLSQREREHVPRHENLWREDHVYDLIIPLGYNDDPIVKGKGSAIFMHIARPNYEGTEGCIALAQQDLLDILPHLSINTRIQISDH